MGVLAWKELQRQNTLEYIQNKNVTASKTLTPSVHQLSMVKVQSGLWNVFIAMETVNQPYLCAVSCSPQTILNALCTTPAPHDYKTKIQFDMYLSFSKEG